MIHGNLRPELMCTLSLSCKSFQFGPKSLAMALKIFKKHTRILAPFWRILALRIYIIDPLVPSLCSYNHRTDWGQNWLWVRGPRISIPAPFLTVLLPASNLSPVLWDVDGAVPALQGCWKGSWENAWIMVVSGPVSAQWMPLPPSTPLCEAYPITYRGQQQKHQPKPDPHKHMWFITVIAVVSVSNVPKSILVLHTHHAAVFPPIQVTTIGLSASVLTGNAFSDEKGAPFLSWDRHSFYILAVTPPGSREVSSLLTALRGGLLLLHTNTFC